MSIRNLQYLFRPASVAVIGASNTPNTVGEIVTRNLRDAGFAGPVMPVNPKREDVAGIPAFPSIEAMPEAPDLAVVCTPAATVPGIIGELGARSTRAAIVIAGGLERARNDCGVTLQQAMLDAAKPHLLRVLGPDSIGLMNARIGLNASFAHASPLPGKLAFISQSGALATALLDHAKSVGIGLSHCVSIGNGADVDFADVLDFLGSDPYTRAVLLYIESIGNARKFMSAARAAARNKPVLAIRGGRASAGAQAAALHSGGIAGADAVIDAAIRRAGMLRVESVLELFDAVETLDRMRPLKGERLGILTNGGGPGVMAVDALEKQQGTLSQLSDETKAALDALLPPYWSGANPVDILGDAPAERHADALRTLLDDKNTDAVLFLHAPHAVVSSGEVAEATAAVVSATKKNVLACWLGGDAVEPARRHFADARIPTYETPEHAVKAFLHMVEYGRNQQMLMETPDAVPERPNPATETVRSIVANALAAKREWLSDAEVHEILAAYEIPVVSTRVVRYPADAAQAAEAIGFPVALKVISDDIRHRPDVGGVVLDIETAGEVRAAAIAMTQRLETQMPEAKVNGFVVQPMVRWPQAQELAIGMIVDPVFGPVITFGQGGVAAGVIADQAMALPPLNTTLARELISRTRVANLLSGYRGHPKADMRAIHRVLLRIAQLVIDVAEFVEIEVNPLLADANGVIALDARMRVQPAAARGADRLSIPPYPNHLEEEIAIDGQPVLLRPIRPEDEPQHNALFHALSPEDVRFRFFGAKSEMAHSELARYTQIDYDREMAFIATRQNAEGKPETLGAVRVICDPDNIDAELGISVRSDLKGIGLGLTLLEKIITYCRDRGTEAIIGETLAENRGMRRLVEKAGFESKLGPDGDTVEFRLPLNDR